MGTILLPHLITAWHVDQAILSEENRLVVIRFGDPNNNPDLDMMDEVLSKVAPMVQKWAVVYVCDISKVPDFNHMYGMYCAALFPFERWGLGSFWVGPTDGVMMPQN